MSMNRREKIEFCLIWFKTLQIGDIVKDVQHQRHNKITNMTSNSLELYHTKVSDKGINCKQWYDIERLIDLTNDYV